MTSDMLQRTKDTTELVMQQAGLSKGEFDDVLLVGGSTYMPVVEQMLQDTTGSEPSALVKISSGAGSKKETAAW